MTDTLPAHSPVGASTAKRLLACPASVGPGVPGVEDDESEHATLGSAVHDMIEASFKARGDAGWSGTMSLPRVLSLGADGSLRMNPPQEIEQLRYHGQKQTGLTIADGTELAIEGMGGNSLELELEMRAPEAREFGIKVCCSPGGEEQTPVFYDAVERKLKVDTTKSSLTEGAKSVEAGPFTLPADEPLRLRVFVDKSVVEVFANGRQAVMRRIYPSRPDSIGVKLFSRGGPAEVRTVQSWEMAPSNPY